MFRPKRISTALAAFHETQAMLGGNFHRQTNLNPRVFSSAVHTVDRINSPNHITRITLHKDGFVLVHKHRNVSEQFKVLELFEDAYGHLFFPNMHRERLEENVGRVFTFEKNQLHGLALLRGFALTQTEIFGEFDPLDIYTR